MLTHLLLAYERFLNFNGEQGARLSREQRVWENNYEHQSLLFALLSPVLFYYPEGYLTALSKLWIDESICANPWEKFIDNMKQEWVQAVVYVSNLPCLPLDMAGNFSFRVLYY